MRVLNIITCYEMLHDCAHCETSKSKRRGKKILNTYSSNTVYKDLCVCAGEGLKVALKLFPEGLTTGTPPTELTGVKAKVTQRADQTQFTNEDINKVEMFLDNVLEDKGSTSQFVYLHWLLVNSYSVAHVCVYYVCFYTRSVQVITLIPAISSVLYYLFLPNTLR